MRYLTGVHHSVSSRMDNLINSVLSPLESNVFMAFRHIIPSPEDRIAITWTNVWSQILFLVPAICMAYLARRPDTYHVRLAILPWALYFILRAMYGYAWIDPQFKFYNVIRCQSLVVALSNVVEFGLTPAGILKKGEVKSGVYRSDYKPPPSPSSDLAFLRAPRCISDTIHLVQSVRGLSYQCSEGVHVPPHTRPQSPTSAFFKATMFSFIIHFMTLDLLAASMKQFFPLASQSSGTIFDPSLPPYPIPWRYISSTTLVWITAFAMQAAFDTVYDFLTLVGVGLCGQQATDWPPFMDHPWHSDSLHVYWGRRWHQQLRRTLLILGGYPARWTSITALSLLGVDGKLKKKAGDIAMVLGVFIACGLYHEGTAYCMGQGFNHWGWIFYVIQGPLMIGERVWKQLTGRQVRGRWGTFWVAFVLLVGPQKLFNSWYERGLGASTIVPPAISPTRRVFFPLGRIILSWAGIEGVLL